MSFFVCNKCYTFVEKSSQTFILTQCGHIFCNRCTSEGWKKCPECGIEDFDSMPLTQPPNLEATMNYFDKLEPWLKATLKASEFHDEQLRISMRGLEKTEQKYEQLKAKYTASYNDMEKDMERYALLKKQSAEVDCALQTLERQFQSSNRVAMEIDTSATGQSGQKFDNYRRFQTKTPGSAIPRQSHFSSTHKAEFDKLRTPLESIPESPFQLGSALPTASYRSTPSSAFVKLGISTPSNDQKNFLYPATTKVPKSATLRARPQTSSRLSCKRNDGF